jgi:hypothetical protein
LDSDGNPVLNSGYEFTVSTRGSVPADSSLLRAQSIVVTAVQETIAAILNGKLFQ